MYNYIYDPLSKKYININSFQGNSILNNYINQLGGSICGYNKFNK